jgi:hypothetical protein
MNASPARRGPMRQLAVLLSLCLSVLPLAHATADPPEASIVPAPGSAHPLAGGDAAWTWFGGPRAVSYDGQFRRVYTGWMSSKGEVKVAAIDRDNGSVEVQTLWTSQDPDDHSNPSILVRPDGRLMVFCAPHCWRLNTGVRGQKDGAIYYRVSEFPEDISSWGEPRVIDQNVPGPFGWTYPKPVQLSAEDGRIYLFWRGGNGCPALAISDDGDNWSLGGVFIQTGGRRPYMVMASDGVDEIHIAFTYGHPDESPRNAVYYVVYRDGALYHADGSKICNIWELPLTSDQCDLVYDGESDGRGWVWDIAIDDDGSPVIAYAVFPSTEDHRYRYARWRDGEWRTHELTEAGPAFPRKGRGVSQEVYYSGGIAIDKSAPDVVYLSRRVDGVYEIERWVTRDAGDTWQSCPVTAGSSVDNVRPTVPLDRKPGDPLVLWMAGVYYRYDIFGTNILYLPDVLSLAEQ